MRKEVFILIVAMALFIPGALMLLGYSIETGENRKLAVKPFFSLKRINEAPNKTQAFYYEIIDYKNGYDQYYTDNFIFKQQLFRPYRFIQQEIFQCNPVPHKVVLGKDGWMFLGNSFSNVILESRGLDKFKQSEILQITDKVDNVSKTLENLGCTYYLAIAPNKHNIYGNQLFSSNYTGKTKMSQLDSALSKNNIHLIDLGKGFDTINEQLFFKTNTHWNDLGAFYGYTNLVSDIKNIYSETRTITLDRTQIIDSVSWQEDLSKMLDLKIKEVHHKLKIKEANTTKLSSFLEVPNGYSLNPETYELRYRSDANSLKVLVFRDSFSSALTKYIAASFGETVFIWDNNIDLSIVTKEKPDIVIYEIVQRDIDYLREFKVIEPN